MAWGSLIRNVIIFVAVLAVGNAHLCIPRQFGYDSHVCVCNSTYCDSAPVDVPTKGLFRIYETGRSGKRFDQQTGIINLDPAYNIDALSVNLALNPNLTFQKIHGFGGAFTDSTGINMRLLSLGAQEQIIETYFGANGASYTLGRVPIGGSDFSTRPYTLDDHFGDITLQQFALTHDDLEYKIPFMQRALQKSPNLRFLSSAWSAPAWMKTNKQLTGIGYLEPAFYQVYAEYLLRFVEEYRKHGLPMWAITTGNEPTDTVLPAVKFQTMGWTPKTVAAWVALNLGPTLARSASANETLIVMLDDQRSNLPWYPELVFSDLKAEKYISGIAVHWYFDTIFSPELLDKTGIMFPNKFLLLTESCIDRLTAGNTGGGTIVRLGEWLPAQRYTTDIMQNLNHFVGGWIDWNLVLDRAGGPNWVQNYVDAPIITNPETDEFFKQPSYYALAHFSKFLQPGARRIHITPSIDVHSIAFLTPKDEIVIVLYNEKEIPITVTVADPEQGNVRTNIPEKSIQTIIYKR